MMYFIENQSLKYDCVFMNMKGRRVHEIPSYYEDITAVCFSLQSSIVDHPPLLLLPLQRSKRNVILHAWSLLDNLLSDSGVCMCWT